MNNILSEIVSESALVTHAVETYKRLQLRFVAGDQRRKRAVALFREASFHIGLARQKIAEATGLLKTAASKSKEAF
jgi:hypothetical protein